MKKYFFLLLIFISADNAFSQDFYFTVGGSDNFPTTVMGNENLCSGLFANGNNGVYYSGFEILGPFTYSGGNTTESFVYSSNGSYTFSTNSQAVNKGIGGGFSFSIAAGYNVSRNISFELGLSYLVGTTMQSSISENVTTYSYFAQNDTTYDNYSISSQLQTSPRYRIMPSIKISANPAKITPYLKAGFVFSFGGNITITNNYNETYTDIQYGIPYITPYSANSSVTASGGMSFGFSGSAGADYTINDIISVYMEVTRVNERWTPTTGNITAFSITPGPGITVSSPQFTYSDNVSTSGVNTGSSSSSELYTNSQEPRSIFTNASWGIAIGAKINLVKPKAKTPELH